MALVSKATLEKMNTLEVVEKIIEHTNDTGLVSTAGTGRAYINELAHRLGIEPLQALFLAVFIDQCDDNHVRVRDLARHFNCRNIAILAKVDVIDQLVKLRVIARRKGHDGDISYRVPRRSLEAIKDGKLPEKDDYEHLTAKGWVNVVDDLINQRSNDEITDDELEGCIDELMTKNQHLKLARTLMSFKLDFTDLKLFLVMSMLYINNHDDRIQRGDIDDYFERYDLRSHVQELEYGSHVLMDSKLVEHACVDGQVESNEWCLTDYAKYDVFEELNLKQPTNVRSNLTRYDDIRTKKMYYTPKVEKQVDQLASLLEHDKMMRVVKRLEKSGMRKGFTCIFYGGPGTGKTETAMQLARMTKRDVMLVDVPSIRSKWVGDTEKNIKALFDRYRRAVDSAKDGNAPILLFNEADALLNKRNEGTVDSVDKMENAMQNIILQEMESLEGIMIATTNLTGSLDDAFERRFLYKVEFDKPTPKERKHIWKAMLPDLSDNDALTLAERFDFSGGQIENITRKRIITDILEERDELDINSIIESCKTELINGKNNGGKKLGF